ncbi:MAG: acyl carrier protein [Cyanobacteria bacterium J06560_6]
MTRQRSNNASIATSSPELLTTTPLDISGIQDWLAEQVARQLGIKSDDIDTRKPFHSYGLDSVQAMAIASQGKQRFGLEISPLVIWNCPTIESLSEHIDKALNDESESFEI